MQGGSLNKELYDAKNTKVIVYCLTVYVNTEYRWQDIKSLPSFYKRIEFFNKKIICKISDFK